MRLLIMHQWFFLHRDQAAMERQYGCRLEIIRTDFTIKCASCVRKLLAMHQPDVVEVSGRKDDALCSLVHHGGITQPLYCLEGGNLTRFCFSTLLNDAPARVVEPYARHIPECRLYRQRELLLGSLGEGKQGA